MKMLFRCLFAFTLTSLPQALHAEDKNWALGVSVGFYSDYMFRGFNLYDGSSIQPSLSASYDTGYGTLSYSPWMHLSAEGDRQEEKFTELDHTLAYTISADALTFKVGHIWYTYPKKSDGLPDTEELFATLVWDDSNVSPFSLTPSLSVYHDYDLVDGQYYELGLSHNFNVKSLGEGFNVTGFAAFGFAGNSEAIYANNGLVQVTTGLSTTLNWGDIAVGPTVNYTFGVDDNTVDELWFGMSLSYSL